MCIRDRDGYAIGGLAVGESTEEMYRIIDVVEPYMPADKPRYLMGVGTPSNIIESVARGVDMFDCVMPSRNARHATVFTWSGIMHLTNKCYETDSRPIDEECDCPVCRNLSLIHILNDGTGESHTDSIYFRDFLSGKDKYLSLIHIFQSYKHTENACFHSAFPF